MSLFLAVGDLAAVFLATVAISYSYEYLAFASEAPRSALFLLAALLSASFTALATAMKSYRYEALLLDGRPIERVMAHWCVSFAVLLGILFVSKSSADYSRGAIALLFVAGLGVVAVVRLSGIRLATHLTRTAAVSSGRTVLVGDQDRIAEFLMSEQPAALGMEIAGTSVLSASGSEPLLRELDAIVRTTRQARPEVVMLVLPWSDVERIRACAFRLMELPVGVQLAPDALFKAFPRPAIARRGGMTSLSLVSQPLSRADLWLKRGMDLVLAMVGLAITSPLFLAIALAIKLESRGPVFFRQRRYGYNRGEFNVLKFRSMAAAEADRDFRQATTNDPRVTRVGRILRRTSLDELPQLLNVLFGTMSLVGPRPHPVALEERYFDRIALYGRRHNMKPGITGWAQVNGFRGETSAEVQMRARLVFDIYYMDNWSLGFDLAILFLTVFSRKSFRNAV